MIDDSLESGLAVRTFEAANDRAGFAASATLSIQSLRWALDAASRWRGTASAAAPDAQEPIESERRDLDPDVPLPTAEELTVGVAETPYVTWIEAGITVEVLMGRGGWVAARRRARSWVLAGDAGMPLSAQRGISKWRDLLDGKDRHPIIQDSSQLTLLSGAAAVLVSALADHFHGSDRAEWVDAGSGWEVDDQPANPSGLVGGSFDDAGFSTASRVLAKNGLWVGALSGPGAFRRESFREPPVELASNLVMPGAAESPVRGRIAARCNLLRLSNHVWVLELEFVDGKRVWVRTTPERLLAACRRRVGVSEPTASGPIVPAVQFDESALV